MARTGIAIAIFAAGVIIAVSAAVAIRSDSITSAVIAPAAAHTKGQQATAPFQRTPQDSAACLSAKRQIDMYSRALSQMNTAAAQNHPAVAVYRQARQAETQWLDQHCRSRFDAVVTKTQPRIETPEARS